jgi:uncharacterized protein YhaN
MRISRLTLGRYGHLSDATLDFPASRGLHVVLGPNEAGKSTALAAIGDALFGFPNRSPFAFLHATRDLRIGFSLCSADGRTQKFVRRKGRRDDLLDDDDHPLPQSALAAFLGGATRERFERIFGLDAAELREGGAAILEGRGEVGETLLQAHTGLHGFRALAEKLGEEATRLFGDRRGRRELFAAVDTFKAARQSLDDRTVEPAAYKQKNEERERLASAIEANRHEAEILHAERTRLDRIRRTSHPRAALARATAARDAMGPIPSLPADAEQQRQTAFLASAKAAHDLERERTLAAECQATLDSLPLDEAILVEAPAIDRLVADQNAIRQARRDRETQRILAEKSRQVLQDMARRLGLAGKDFSASIPDSLAREEASRAITEHVRLTARAEKAIEQRDEARAAHIMALAHFESLPAPADTTDLLAAIDAAKGEARIEAEREAAARAADAAEAELQRRLAALPLWDGTAGDLAAAPMPLDSMVSECAQGLEARQTEFSKAASTLAGLAQQRHDIATKKQKFGAPENLPTSAAIAALRGRRDDAWAVIGDHLRREILPPNPSSLAENFEHLVHEADRLADHRTEDAERVFAFEQLLAHETSLAAQHDEAADVLARSESAHAAAQKSWEELWRPAGIRPLPPPAMAEWLRRRDDVLSQMAALNTCRDRCADIDRRYAAVSDGLARLLPGDFSTGSLNAMRLAAERICKQEDQHGKTLAQEKARADDTAARAAAADRDFSRIEAALSAWQARWGLAAAALGLPEKASPEAGKLALDLWNQVDMEVAASRETQSRIAQMTAAIEEFDGDTTRIAERVTLATADADPHAMVGKLAERLDAARSTARERTKLLEVQEKRSEKIAALEKLHAEAEGRLSALRLLAGAADDDALQAAIRRTGEAADLSRQIHEREAELSRLDDGKSLAELEAEAAGIGLDLLPPRIADIEDRLKNIFSENTALAAQLADTRRELDEMTTGRHATDAAQDMQNALSEIDDIAARYVRLRLAHTLLRAGMEKFRREQQGPLLRRAGILFAELTEGRYEKLGVDQSDDGKLLMVASRPDGTECPADRLSEGTRDQLYLALRLAAIESFAARAEPLPFIADDLLVNFDDRRTAAALRVLARFGQVTQTILFTHHAHIAAMADRATTSLHHLPPSLSVNILDRVG